MRLCTAALLIATAVAAAPVQAQVLDRYGGVNTYPAPTAREQPQRVLSWPGKTIPAPPQPSTANSTVYNGRPTYGAQLQQPPYAQAPNAPPAPYAQQRRATMYPSMSAPAPLAYYPMGTMPPPAAAMAPAQAPQPAPQGFAVTPQGMPGQAPMPQQMAPQMMATQQGTLPRQAPMAPYPQAQPMPAAPQAAQMGDPSAFMPPPVNPPVGYQTPPTSIYAPTPQAAAEAPPTAQPTTPVQTARLYSVHREFGLQPDAPVATAPPAGEAIDLAELPSSEPVADPSRDRTTGVGAGEDPAPPSSAQRELAQLRLRSSRN